MKPSENVFNKIDELIELAIDGSISPEQSRQLNDLIAGDAAVRRHYCEYVQLNLNIERLIHTVDAADLIEYEMIFDQELWQKLADEEQQAPAAEISQDQPTQELIQKVVYPPREKRKISRFGIITLLNAAAVVLFFLILRAAPPKGGIEVATLSDSLHAEWMNAEGVMQDGKRLVISTHPVVLTAGLAQLKFDNNAGVVIEGPAEFTILAQDRIGLHYGNVYVTVPEEAVGFSVYTKNAKIIDLGTEFGVAVNTNGDTRLHVITGKTTLIVGEKANRVSVEVEAGGAKQVMAESLTVSDISSDAVRYVRYFDSRSGAVWRGQPTLCLADVVGGGNGFGTGQFNHGINPVTGEFSRMQTANRSSENGYRMLPQSPFVDGVFVPNGSDTQIISSQGHIFQECPATHGIYFTEITNTPDPLDEQTMTLNDVRYSSHEKACIFMHSNLGITFDLDALRSRLPAARIVRFQSHVGVSDTSLREFNADFWVLVDGKLRYKKEHIQQTGLVDTIQIELSSTDRFLTLVTTDGGDPDARELPDGFIRRSIDCDWCVFGSPVLILESK